MYYYIYGNINLHRFKNYKIKSKSFKASCKIVTQMAYAKM